MKLEKASLKCNDSRNTISPGKFNIYFKREIKLLYENGGGGEVREGVREGGRGKKFSLK